MIDRADIIWGIFAPAIIALVATLLSALPRRRERTAQPWGPALAISASVAAAFYGIAGRASLRFPPVTGEGWIIYLGVPAVLIAVAATVLRKHRWTLTVASIAVLIALAWLLMPPIVRSDPLQQRMLHVTIVSTILIVWWLGLTTLAARSPGPVIPLLLSGLAGASALIIIGTGHTASLGKIAGGIAIALFVIALLAIWLKNVTLSRGPILALAVALPGLLLAGHFFADLTRADVLLLLAAPLTMWLGEVPIIRRRPWPRFAARAVPLLLVILIPLVPAAKGLRDTLNEQTESFSY